MDDTATSLRSIRRAAAIFVAFLAMGLRPAIAATVGTNVNLGAGQEGAIAINPTDGTNLIAIANFSWFYSNNTGASWGIPTTTSGFSSFSDNAAGFDTLGNAFLEGLQFPPGGGRGIILWKSTDKGHTYPAALTSWVEQDPGAASDQPYMAVDTSPTSPYKDNIYVVWSEYGTVTLGNTANGFRLLFSRSTNHGASFSTPIDISDSCGGQEGNSYVDTGPNGEVYVTWLGVGCGAVMFDKSLDGGVTWGVDKVVRTYPAPVNSFILTDDVRGNTTVAVDRSNSPYRGTIYVSSIDTNGPSGGAADAWVVRSTNGGTNWTNAILLSDGPRGAYKYYFQPRITVSPGGRLDATWYDTRFNTSTNTNSITYDQFATYSIDGAATFAPSIRVSSVSSVKTTHCTSQGPCGERILYEYIGIASAASQTHPLWTDGRTGSYNQFTATISGLPGFCANGLVEAGEQCDDGNFATGDCCNATCQFEANGSACPDDGNACTSDTCNGAGACVHGCLVGTSCSPPCGGTCQLAGGCSCQ